MAASPSITLCADIIPNVLEHLSPGPKPSAKDFPAVIAERKIRRHTLAMSARLCRAFKVPALNLLWRVLDDVVPLLSVIPSYSVKDGSFNEAITDVQWGRFQEYAGRVRELNARCNEYDQYQEQDITWMVLMQRSQGLPLFPRLERLAVDVTRGPLLMLLGPALTHLDVSLSTGSHSPRNNLNLIADLVRPYLPHLKGLSWYEYDVARSQAPGKIDVSALSNLHEVQIRHKVSATRSMLVSFMAFPQLRKLDLDFRFTPEDRAAVAEAKLEPGFFDLKELHLCASFDDPPCLELLSLTHQGHFHRVGRATIVQGLHIAYPKIPRQIRRLHLRIFDHDSYYDDGVTDLPEFAMLLTLRDVREVTLSVNLTTQFTNDNLLALCGAWPALTRFEFAFCREEGSERRPNIRRHASLPTFTTLVAFARAHPHLERLALPCLNVEQVPDITSPDLLDIPRHGLRLLRLSSLAPGTRVVLLALALDRMFPELELGYASMAQGARSSESIYDADVLMMLLLTLQVARRSKVNDVEHGEGLPHTHMQPETSSAIV
ncbi:hypothetical protein C8Q79DRAFT_1001572 [Trametes meyenii]|nr:hypothetical protein C8Q79DRAFT_1001572 [Trametes meyenii]